MTNKKLLPIFFLIFFLFLTGCDSRALTVRDSLGESLCELILLCKQKRVMLDVQDHNYTDYKISAVSLQRPHENNIEKAISGAVSWKSGQMSPVEVKVWWMVIYDEKLFNHGSGYSKVKNKSAAPGTVWCEAIVKVKEPFTASPQHIGVDFYPDGHVEVELLGPLSADPKYTDAEKSKLPRLSKGQYCLTKIDNPWYGIKVYSNH